MFEIGETIVHNKVGLCTVKEMTQIEDRDYYVLTSNRDDTKIMIPVNNAGNLVRKIITKQEIDEMVAKISETEVEPIYDFKARVKRYDELLKSGKTENLLTLLKMIDNHKKEHKNLTVADKEIAKIAGKLLFDELAYVLNISPNEAEKYLFKVAM